MNTQQLAELLKTWPEFDGRLDWLEQYPPDTPIMDALRNAPCGGDYIGDQWLALLTWYALSRVSSLSAQYFKRQTAYAYQELEASERQNKKKWERKLEHSYRQYELDSSEAAQKAHKEAVWRAYDERYRANHEALVKFLKATNGLFEAVLEILYDEHKKFQRALGDVCDDLVGRG